MLWKARHKAPVFSRRWIKSWAKRLYNLPALIRIMWRTYWLRAGGAHVGDLSIVLCVPQGNLKNLDVGSGCSISKDALIGLHAEVKIGDNVVINSGARLITGTHDLHDPYWRMKTRSIEIKDFAWIATGAVLLPGTRVGYGAVVGACAVVRGDVPDFAVVTGNPGVVVTERARVNFRYCPTEFVAAYESWIGDRERIWGQYE